MSGRLLLLECKKVWGDRRFRILLAVLLVLQLFVLHRGEEHSYPYSMKDYKALYGTLEEKEPEEALAYVEEQREKLQILWEENAMAGLPFVERQLLGDVEKELTVVIGRDARIAETIRQADLFANVGLFQSTADAYTLRNLAKTKADFQGAKLVKVERFEPSRGIMLALANGIGDAFVLLLLFLAVDRMVFQGYESGAETIVASSPLGKSRGNVYRGLALVSCAWLIWALFFGSSLLCGAIWYGLGDLTRPVQMLPDYITCLSTLRVGEFLLLFFIGKWLVFSVLALLLLGIVGRSRNMLLPCGLMFALFAVGYLLWNGVGDGSAFRLLRYANLYYLLRPDIAAGVYRNMNVFGNPISGFWVWTAVVLAAGLFAVVWLSRKPELRVAGQKNVSPKGAVLRKRFRSLLLTEHYKVWILRHVAVLLLAVLCWQLWAPRKEIWLPLEERIYQYYMDLWEGEVDGKDAELLARIAEEEQELQLALSGQSQKYASEDVIYFMPALMRAKGRVEALQEVANRRREQGQALPVLFYEGRFTLLVEDSSREATNGCMAFCLLLLVVVHVTGLEYQSGMRTMMQATKCGRRSYLRNKILVTAGVCLVIVLLAYLPDIWMTLSTWGSEALAFPVYSLPAYLNFGPEFTVGGYLLLILVLRYLVLLGVGAVLLFAMEFIRNETTGLPLLGGLLGLPFLLYYIGGAAHGQWGLLRLLGMNGYFQG